MNQITNQLDITGKTHQLSITGKVTGKLPEYIDLIQDHLSYCGVVISLNEDRVYGIPFHAFGPNKREIIRSLCEGDIIRVTFILQGKKQKNISGQHKVYFKIRYVELIESGSIPI